MQKNSNKAQFNFRGYGVEVITDNEELIERLNKDFSFFKVNELFNLSIKINCWLLLPPLELIPKMSSTGQSELCLTYDVGETRYNDYYGEALVIYDFAQDKAQIYSQNLHRLHELCYLLILSRTGKALDLEGLHRIHAFALAKNNTTLITMMPMKGGKSTLFLGMIEEKKFDFLSDDAPLVDRFGVPEAFPIRVGLEKDHPFLAMFKGQTYQLNRKIYGEKNLIDIANLKVAIARKNKKVILAVGKRANYDVCNIISVRKIRLVIPLLLNMVIGFGLPMIKEYFLEPNIVDYFKRFKILISRILSAFFLLMRAETYVFVLGNNIKRNQKEISLFLENKSLF